MTIEDQIAQALEDQKWNEERAISVIRSAGDEFEASFARIDDELEWLMHRVRGFRDNLLRKSVGWGGEVATGVEAEPLPRIFYEKRMPHEPENHDEDPLKLYGEAAE